MHSPAQAKLWLRVWFDGKYDCQVKPACLRDLFGIHWRCVLYRSPPITPRTAIPRCYAGHAPDSGAGGYRNCSTRRNSPEWGASSRKAVGLASTGRGNGNSPRGLSHRRIERRASRVDRWARHNLRTVLGGGADPCSSGQSSQFTARCRRAAEMRRIFSHRSVRLRARRHRDGPSLSRFARRRRRIRRTHLAHVDGEHSARLAHHAAQLRVAALSVRRSRRSMLGKREGARTITRLEPAHGDPRADSAA